MVFPGVTYGCERWTAKKAEHQRTDAFELWCWKTLESPLDSKEIQQVHPKGNLSWIFIGRTDAEAEAPILWPPHDRSQLIGKDPDAFQGKVEGMRRRGWQRLRWLDGIINSMDILDSNVSLSKLQETVKDREGWHAAVHGVTKSQTKLSNWTELKLDWELYNGHMPKKFIPTVLLVHIKLILTKWRSVNFLF